MRGLGRMVVSSSPMRPMRPHRLLRQFTKSACVEALRRHGSSDHHELRAGRALVLRLSHRGILCRPKTSCACLPSGRSAGAGTGRSGAVKLANAASRIRAAFFGFRSRGHKAPSGNPTGGDMSKRIDKSWLVFTSIENLDHNRCVDLFSRPDGSCGFEEFRRDVEDRGEWTPVQYYSGSVYTSQEAALAAAMQAVAWLPDAIGQSPAAQKLLRRISG
jgi:hypothetical protein